MDGLGGQQGSLSIYNSSVRGNISHGDGGGIAAYKGAVVVLQDVDVANNKVADTSTYGQGGGLYVTQSAANLTNVLITGNSPIPGSGNVLAVDDSEVAILNGTIAGNNPQGTQAALLWSAHLTITNSILWNNALALQADPTCPSCFTVSYSDIEGGWTGTGNINLAPLFVAGDDYNQLPTIVREAVVG